VREEAVAEVAAGAVATTTGGPTAPDARIAPDGGTEAKTGGAAVIEPPGAIEPPDAIEPRGAKSLPTSSARPTQYVVAWIASGVSWLFERVPDRPLHRLAAVAGVMLYLSWRRRRRLVRGNLRLICRWLVANGKATPVVARAARSPLALERLVMGAFGHYLRYYIEVALAPSYDAAYLSERLTIESKEIVNEALAARERSGEGRIFVGLHLGGIELPGLYAVRNAGVPITAPMEAIPNAPLQEYLVRRRGAIGVRIIPIAGARHALLRALARGEIAGLIADRDLTGDGHPVTLFGEPTRLPAGPGLLALSSGAPAYVAAARRTGLGQYALRGIRLHTPTEGTLRERLGYFMDEEARAIEEIVSDAPEQWWTIFFPIWPAGFARAAASGGPA
jgi:KDO2-lipid IV(A) lauroyltransferase